MTGCGNHSSKLIYYSDKKIKNYVKKTFGSDYNFVNKISYTDEDSKIAYEYKF